MHVRIRFLLRSLIPGLAAALVPALLCLALASPMMAQTFNVQGTWNASYTESPAPMGLPSNISGVLTLYQSSSSSVVGTAFSYIPGTAYFVTAYASGTVSGSTLTLTTTPTAYNLPGGVTPCGYSSAPFSLSTSGGVTTASVPSFHPCGETSYTVQAAVYTLNGFPHGGCSPCGPGPKSGLPIDVTTGNANYSESDYTTAGMNPLALIRTYNSFAPTSTYAAAMGKEWRTNFDRYLILSSTQVIAERPGGDQVTFTLVSSVWTPPSDTDMTLTQSGSTWTLTTHDDTVETYTAVTSPLNGILIGSQAGRLSSIKLRNGYTQTMAYNGSNQLTSVSDSYSRSLVFTYTGSLITQATTPDSLVLTYGYNTAGTLLTSVSYNTSPVTSKTYDYTNASFPLALTSVIDENGNTYQTFSFDSYGRALTSQSGAVAGGLTVTYNDTAATRKVTNPSTSQTNTYTLLTIGAYAKFTGLSRTATTTVPAAATSFTFDSNGFTASTDDWNSNTATYTNNAHGDPTTIVEASGSSVARTTTIVYDTTWVHLPDTITTTGVTASFTYDGNGNPLTVTLTDTTSQTVPYSTNGQVRTWTYTYDSTGHVLTAKNPNGHVTTFTYDSTGALTSTTNALSQAVNVTSHTGGGRPLTTVDANGITTTFTYSPRNWLLTKIVDSTGGAFTTTNTYDAAGNLTKVQQPDGSYITNGYDHAHRLTSTADSFGNSVNYTLDAFGNQTAANVENPSATVTKGHTATFDTLGRKLTDVGGMGQTTTFAYDSDGNVSSIKDALSNNTVQHFDVLNRLMNYVEPSPTGASYLTLDAHDRLLTFETPGGQTITYVYDGFGDEIQEISADRGTWVYTYDSDGNLTKRVDGSSHTMNATYDALDRPLTNTYPSDSSENVSFTYDQTGVGFSNGIGRLTSLTDAAGSLTRSYDTRGNLSSEARVIGSATLTTSYGYDAASRVLTLTYPDNAKLTYTRDAMGRITAASLTPSGGSPMTVVSGLTYEPFGPVTGWTFGNGVTSARAYDLDYRLTSIADAGTSITPLSLTYTTYSADNNPTKITDNVTSGNTQTLTYDALSFLGSGSGNYGSQSFTYSANGILAGESSTPNIAIGHSGISTPDAIVIGSASITPSATGGNITGFSPAYNGVTGLTYNQANRMATAVNGTTTLGTYTYDALGQRLIKTASSTTTHYQYGLGGSLLEETNPSETTDYIYLGGLPIGTFDPSGGGKLYFVHTDRMGTPMAATNSAQSVVWATTYQPLGQTQTVVGSITQNLRLPGQYFDGETGFNHNGYRDYMPQLGHYVESDPIGLAGGYATFRFANHNPLAYTDRFGLSTGSPNPGQGTNTSGSGVNASAGLRYECWIESKAPYGGHLVGAWLTLEGWGALTDYGPWKGQKPAACEGQTQEQQTVTYVASYEETGYTSQSPTSGQQPAPDVPPNQICEASNSNDLTVVTADNNIALTDVPQATPIPSGEMQMCQVDRRSAVLRGCHNGCIEGLMGSGVGGYGGPVGAYRRCVRECMQEQGYDDY